jgi:hypothetical protein
MKEADKRVAEIGELNGICLVIEIRGVGRDFSRIFVESTMLWLLRQQIRVAQEGNIAAKAGGGLADIYGMFVSLCMLAVLLFALAAVALVYAIVTADNGYEDESGFHCAPIPVNNREEQRLDFVMGRPVTTVPVCWFL